jgi:serine/threonine protein kinase
LPGPSGHGKPLRPMPSFCYSENVGQDAHHTLTQDAAMARVGSVLVDKWRLDALLGVGGMASVYAATHRNGMRAAIKLLHPELCAQPTFVARFLREGYVANKIGHPAGVIVLDDDGTVWGSVFLVMELLEGDSLDRFTRRRGQRLPLKRILGIADDVLDLLATAHSKGILHRDIKPANIFLTVDDQVKVLDFGIARLAERALDGSATQTGTAMGTPSYMPPEQARGRWNMVDARTDLWALGATLYALLSGDRPRRAETVQEELLLAMTAPLISLAHLAPAVPGPVVEFVDRAVAFEMDPRFPDARSMQDALRELMRDGRLDQPSRPPPPPRPAESGALRDAPSNPSGPRPDSAPVIVGPRVSATDPTQLGSGRTMGGSETAPPRRRRGLGIAVVVTLVLGSAVIGGNAWFRIRRAAEDSAQAQAAPPLASPLPAATGASAADPTVTGFPTPTPPSTGANALGANSPPPSSPQPQPPEPGDMQVSPPQAGALPGSPRPSTSSAATGPRAPGGSRKPTPPKAPPPTSGPSAEPVPVNPFDQRF